MHKITKTILFRHIALHCCIAVTTLFLLTACIDDLASEFSHTPLRLCAQAEAPKTRAAADIQGSSFDKDETIAVYIKDTGGNPIADGNDNAHWPALFKTSREDETTHLNVLTFSPQLYYPADNKHISIYAFYPSTVAVTDGAGNLINEPVTFTVDTDQTGTDGDKKYKESDLMFSKIDDQGRTSGLVNLNFKHKMVKFLFNIVADGDIDIGDCYLTGVKKQVTFNPTDGTMGTASGNEDIKLDNGGAVVIPPQELTGDFIAVHGTARESGQVTKTDAVAKFSLKINNGGNTSRKLESGKVYTVNLSVGYDNFGATYEIGEWDDQAGVISVATYGMSGMSIDNTNIKAEGYDYNPTAPITIDDDITVKYGKAKILAKYEKETETGDYTLQYFNNEHAGKATVLATGRGAYEGYAVATSFKINQIPSSLTYTDSEGHQMEELELTYSRDYTINPTSDTFKDIHLDINGNGTMTYTIRRVEGDETTDISKVAIIEANTGVITIKGSGTVQVNASMADDKDYKASSTSFILKVTTKQFNPDDESKIRVDFDYDPNNPYTYDGKEHKPAVTVWDKVADNGNDNDWTNITTSCTIKYPNPINANDEAKVEITFNQPYSGEIIKTYKINKATPNLRIFENNAAITSTLPLYLAKYHNTSGSSISRTRVAITDYGEAIFTPNTTNDLFTVTQTTLNGDANNNTAWGYYHNTSAVFTANSGADVGNITYTVKVPEDPNGNWTGVSTEFTVYVVKSEFNYDFTGTTQLFTCPATGEYLLEVYGAQGASNPTTTTQGGSGAYVSGKIKLNKGETLYVNVGEAGKAITPGKGNFPFNTPKDADSKTSYSAYNDPAYGKNTITPPTTYSGQDYLTVLSGDTYKSTFSWEKAIAVNFSWNGGSGIVWGCMTYGNWNGTNDMHGGGGGTDISLEWDTSDTNGKDWNNANHMLTRIIVAGGGGGCNSYAGQSGSSPGGAGGGAITGNGISTTDLEGETKPREVNAEAGGGSFDPGWGGQINAGGRAGWRSNTTDYTTTPTNHSSWFACVYFDGRHSEFGGSDGVFGSGGYWFDPDEGGGSGGGGWYGGGAGGQGNSNGPGGGGSSYVWCANLEEYYPTLDSFKNFHYDGDSSKQYNAEHTEWDYLYPYKKSGVSVKNPSQKDYRYIYDATSSRTTRTGNGSAKITCLSTSNTIDLGGRK